MGVFITVKIDGELCASDCNVCVDACSVKVFTFEDGKVAVDKSNEDECIICDICIERCPNGAIKIIKNY